MNYLIAGLCIPLLASCTVVSDDVASRQAGFNRGNPSARGSIYASGTIMERPNIQHTVPTITATGTLTDEQKSTLQDAYSEEMLARDIYTYMVSKYPNLAEVNNIINSEKQHNDVVGSLLDAYGIARPTDYRIYTDTNTTLRKMIDSSLTGAIEVGIMVETGDIDHLVEEYKQIDNASVRQVFENIGGGSFNHLRAFLREAQAAGYTPTTNTSKYLTATELNTRGPLNYKMTDLLKANGLPTYSTNMMSGSGIYGGQGGGRGMGGGMGPGRGNW